MSQDEPSREQLLLEIERLRQEVAGLKQEKADLEILLETTVEHSDVVEAQLQNRAEEAVREGHTRLAQFLDAVPVGVFVVDGVGKLYYANRATRQILGDGVLEATVGQLVRGYRVYQAGTNRAYPRDRFPIWRALKGEQVTVEDIEVHLNGQVIPLVVWANPIFNEMGEVLYAIAAFQDISDRKRSETERETYIQDLLQLTLACERFVPREFLQFLDKTSIADVELGNHVQKEMSVLFADIRNFTAFSEQMTPEENFQFINAYLSHMEPCITTHRGFIDKYIGDGIMALFGGSADDAVRAGIAMLHTLTDYNQQGDRSISPQVRIGIGINTGSLMLGTVGGINRMDTTVISDAVNLAARMEKLTGEYGVTLLISHQTFSQLHQPECYAIRKIDQVKVKGKSEPVTVYEVFDADPPDLKDGKLKTAELFAAALSAYSTRHFKDATQLFSKCLTQNPDDSVAKIYLERCYRSGLQLIQEL
ncbi:MAG TPA: adenylate/guanylate cyclase domain-containing protein [Crinalium sp.]|jgi:PAS domain S-box-containing protein